jgi:uncharacterized protein YidB (DUF937 family)
MGNPLLGQILATALGNRMSRGGAAGPAPGGLGGIRGGIGSIALGGLLARLARGGGGARPSNNRGMLLALMLPLAMRWVQQNGGLGAVLDRLRQHGLGTQANSWLTPGVENHPVSPQDVQRVIGPDQVARFAAQLGVPEHEASEALAEILPELADKLTPDGTIAPQTDTALDAGRDDLESALRELHADSQQLS